MKNLTFLYCAAFLLTAVNTFNHDRNQGELVPANCTASEFGKCLLEIAESLDSDTVNLNKVRAKRSILINGRCAIGETWFLNQCVPCNVYEEITGNIGRGC